MIARLAGKVVEQGENFLLIDTGGIVYEVFLPVTVKQRINDHITPDGLANLIIYHYLHVEPSRNIPVMIGFLNEIEKEFFLSFITVSGIGPKAALKALNQPISLIARAIDAGDVAFLKSLPGIGQQRAKEIVAKLQHKVAKFGLLQDELPPKKEHGATDIENEVLLVLTQLGYKKPEAQAMIHKAKEHTPSVHTAEELLNKVYSQRKTT
ncbi:MAG: helix-hairpin-helix domain-containing protein [Candidatus Omnitrophica bacterium]|nr:helix-hairpin-helix domain-containing protein [Candidatus Omnitrophota bacterium]